MIRQQSLFMVSMLLSLPVARGQQSTNNDPSSSLAQAKRTVLHDLGELSRADNPSWLVGQNAGHGNSDIRAEYQRNVTHLLMTTGKLPSVLGFDLGYDEIPLRQTSATPLVRQFWQQGGLVTVSMHPPSPFRNSSCHDIRPVNWDDIRRPGSIVQKRWQRTLDRAADFLEQLRDDGVVVLWRPLHEMNGGWFWWCARDPNDRWTSPKDFVALWQDMHRYFSDRGLDNLLWVYAPAVQTDPGQRSVIHYYPGDEFVDVVGLDWYDDQLQNLDSLGSYHQLVQLGKPAGLTEVGPRTKGTVKFDNMKVARAMQRYPRLGFAFFWHNWSGADRAIVRNQNAQELMTNSAALTLDAFRKSRAQTVISFNREP